MDDYLDPAKPLYNNEEVYAVKLSDGDVLKFERGTFKELTNTETGADVFVGQLVGHPSLGTKRNFVCGSSSQIKLVYFESVAE